MKFLSYDGLPARIIRYIRNLFLLNVSADYVLRESGCFPPGPCRLDSPGLRAEVQPAESA